jgi:hypothetical protein
MRPRTHFRYQQSSARPIGDIQPAVRQRDICRTLRRSLPCRRFLIRRGYIVIALRAMLDRLIQLPVRTKGKRFQQHSIADGEHGGDRADAQSQRQYSEHGVARRVPKLPHSKTHVLQNTLQRPPHAIHHLSAAFLILLTGKPLQEIISRVVMPFNQTVGAPGLASETWETRNLSIPRRLPSDSRRKGESEREPKPKIIPKTVQNPCMFFRRFLHTGNRDPSIRCNRRDQFAVPIVLDVAVRARSRYCGRFRAPISRSKFIDNRSLRLSPMCLHICGDSSP